MSATYIESSTASDSELLGAAQQGDERAWERIVQRYQPLINSISRRHRLSSWDAHDVSQHVWVQLLDQAHRLREPRALPGWISTTATRKCYEVLRQHSRAISMDPQADGGLERNEVLAAPGRGDEVDDDLLRDEQRRAVRRGLAELSSAQQQLLMLLVADPPLSYAEISRRMGLPTGSIGPTRARILARLRTTLETAGVHDLALN